MVQDKEEIYKKQIETCEQVRNYINNLFVNKNKIRDKIKELKKECIDCRYRKMLNCEKQCTIGGTIKALEDLLKE